MGTECIFYPSTTDNGYGLLQSCYYSVIIVVNRLVKHNEYQPRLGLTEGSKATYFWLDLLGLVLIKILNPRKL